MKKDTIAVLGCGPAGLLVAHAVAQAGFTPVIYSKPAPSRIGGAQFLHTAIPGITEEAPDGQVNFERVGTAEGYARKVYGTPNADTSWGTYPDGLHDIWNMREAYDNLWALYEDCILSSELSEHAAVALTQQYRAVASTVPLFVICANAKHSFSVQSVGIVYGELEGAARLENHILYNGDTHDHWYRRSVLFGWYGTEFVSYKAPPQAVQVSKPISTNCDCLPQIRRFGRYGQWRKKVLIHDAYWEATEWAGALAAGDVRA